jgi:hypothetical protein
MVGGPAFALQSPTGAVQHPSGHYEVQVCYYSTVQYDVQ